MATATFEIDARDMLKLLTKVRANMPKVISRSINKSAKSAKTAMVKVVRADMGLKAKDTRDGLKLDEARPGQARATITVSTKRISLIKFGGTQLKRAGFKSRLKGGSGTIAGAFKGRQKQGDKKGTLAVFKRRGRAGLPVDKLHGPSLGKVFAKHWRRVGTKRYREQMAKNLKSEINFAARGR